MPFIKQKRFKSIFAIFRNSKYFSPKTLLDIIKMTLIKKLNYSVSAEPKQTFIQNGAFRTI